MKYTIIVCAYNSCRTIAKCLKAISELQYVNYELVLVENNSNDDTFQIASSFLKSSSIPSYKLIKEITPGLLSARKTGLKSAEGDYVVFVDDDNYLTDNYLKIADFYTKPDKNLLIGPRTICFWDESFESSAYACGKQYNSSSILRYKDTLWGCGLIIPRLLAIDVINEVELSGRKGNTQLAGDDTEICLLSYYYGHRAYYNENLILYHDISKSRLNKSNYYETIKGFKASFMRIYYLKNKVYQKHYGWKYLYYWSIDTIYSRQNLIFAFYRYLKYVINNQY